MGRTLSPSRLMAINRAAEMMWDVLCVEVRLPYSPQSTRAAVQVSGCIEHGIEIRE